MVVLFNLGWAGIDKLESSIANFLEELEAEYPGCPSGLWGTKVAPGQEACCPLEVCHLDLLSHQSLFEPPPPALFYPVETLATRAALEDQ